MIQGFTGPRDPYATARARACAGDRRANLFYKNDQSGIAAQGRTPRNLRRRLPRRAAAKAGHD